MDVEFSQRDGANRVALSGRLDSAGVDVIEARFEAGVVGAGLNTLVDLSNVTFLASLGVRMFISTTRALARRSARLVLFGATDAVMEIIESIGFADIVPVARSEAEAIALLAA